MNSSKDSLIEWAERKFQFDKDDLTANRQGAMSKKQKENAMRGGTSLIFTTSVGGVLILIWLVYDALNKEHFLGMLNVAIKGIVIFIILGTFAWMGWRSRKAGNSAVVKSIHGNVSIIQDKKKLYLHISSSEIQFEVEQKVKDIVSPDKEYRFYYCDIDKTILSVEEI